MFETKELKEAIMKASDMEELTSIYEKDGILSDPKAVEIHLACVKEYLSESLRTIHIEIGLLSFLNSYREHPQDPEESVQEIDMMEPDFEDFDAILS